MKALKIVIIIFLFFSCKENNMPKPRAFFKLDLPNKEYKYLEKNCPFNFKIPTYSYIVDKDDCHLFNIYFPKQNATLHVSYFDLKNDLFEHIEESRDLAYKHNIIADGITEQIYINDSLNVYGILYDYIGITATSTQFCLTDSFNYFFRGALYFNTEINDSILPINNFLKTDMKHIIESFHWNE